MSEIEDRLAASLREAATLLRAAGLPGPIAQEMEQLANKVYEPCQLAVVGPVKAGKSTFINALLGEDLAKVGVTETTATVNYFSYGELNEEHPVTCHWRNGRISPESRAFLDSLQGNDIETLQRADGIDYLEYWLPNPYLKGITLIDTPGMGSVEAVHEQRTAEFMNLNSALRARHSEQTASVGGRADAVIYVIGTTVAFGADREFLELFGQTRQGTTTPFNAIGIMSKVDLYPEVLRDRHMLAGKIASQLEESLNTVLPVSAGLQRQIDQLAANDMADLHDKMALLRRVPADQLEKLLKLPMAYFSLPIPLTAEERTRLKGDLDWTVFTALARIATNPDLDTAGVLAQLNEISGFDTLRDVLNQRIFARRHLLRAFGIASKARTLLTTVRRNLIPEQRARALEDRRRRERFIELARSAHGDPTTTAELIAFIESRIQPPSGAEEAQQRIDRMIGLVFHQLQEDNSDFEALRLIEENAALFSREEAAELRPLLGQNGLETDKRLGALCRTKKCLAERQQYWGNINQWGTDHPTRREVAGRASARYGFIYDALWPAP